jgi:hypothetical protein
MTINDIVVAKAEDWFNKFISGWCEATRVNLTKGDEASFKIGYRDGYMQGMLQCEDFLNWLHEQGFVEKRVVVGDDIRKWRLYHGHNANDCQYYTTAELFSKYVQHLQGL